MSNETIEIRKEDALKAYKAARGAGDSDTLRALESLFGKELLKPRDVRERIRTFDDACEELGGDHPLVAEYQAAAYRVGGLCPDLDAYLKLRVITAALNEGWEPRFTKDEWRYFPWFSIPPREWPGEAGGDGRPRAVCRSCSSASHYASLNSYAGGGARLALRSEELAVYCGRQFIDIWADFIC